MTVHAFIADLAQRGIVLTVNGDKLRVESPAALLTDELRGLLVRRKAELLAALSRPAASPATVAWINPDPETVLREMCLALAGQRDYPRLALPARRSETIMAGREAWENFTCWAAVPDVAAVAVALEDGTRFGDGAPDER